MSVVDLENVISQVSGKELKVVWVQIRTPLLGGL